MSTEKHQKSSYTRYSKILADLIEDELSDAAIYRYMAENTEKDKYKILLTQLSADDGNHSERLMREYYRLTGHNYRAHSAAPSDYESFKSFLEDRIKKEINAFKTYSKLADSAPNRVLESEYEDFALDETEHAFLLLMILTDL